MRFENRPNFGSEFYGPEEEGISPDFLKEQAHLPEGQWSEKFRQLIKEKSRENQKDNIGHESSSESLREATLERYKKGLGLNEEELKGKKILDLGSGESEFIKYLIDEGITAEAYGIDIHIDEDEVEERFKNHILKGNFEEGLPVKNIDYIVSVGAVSNAFWGEEESMNIRGIIDNSLASLKEGGEIRIYPIQEAAGATPLEGLQASQEKWEELVAEISGTKKAECLLQPRNIKVSGKNNDIILEFVLIIRKKKD